MSKDLSATGKNALKIRVNLAELDGSGKPKKTELSVVKNFFNLSSQERTNFLDEKFGKDGWKSAAPIAPKRDLGEMQM